MHAPRRLSILVLLCVAAMLGAALAPARASSAPLAPDEVPEPLRPWIDWALRGHEDAACPVLHPTPDARECAWPSRLALEVDDGGGRFAVEWRVYRDGFVPLPGDAAAWPQDVTAGEKPAAVVSRGGRPSVHLERGAHRVTGRFAWSALPSLLALPPEVGLLSLRVRGAETADPKRESDGRIWLGARVADQGEAARLSLETSRLVRDEVPLELISRFELDVAGPSREVRVAPGILPGFVPLALTGSLPARVGEDGAIVVQARPGRHVLVLQARHEGPVKALSLPDPPAGSASGAQPDTEDPARGFDPSETWAFEARPALRLVSIEGVPAIDAAQTTLPPEWRALPAYAMGPGVTMTLDEKRRGDADPSPDQLRLARTLWLDFDGGGWTVQDELSGRLSRSWRLEMGPETTLGRVAVGGEDQLVTRLPGGEGAGVEVRQGAVTLRADSRVEGRSGRFPAVGWSADFAEVSAVAQLPPGWRLFHASGVDRADPTWISLWSLLDLFLVLVAALGTARLFGAAAGGLALAALALAWTEPGAPRAVWLLVLACEALFRVLPAGRVRAGFGLARVAALVTLVVLLVPFLVGQVREAFYPSLAMPHASAGERVALRHLEAPVEEAGEYAEGLETKEVVQDSEGRMLGGRVALPSSPGESGEAYSSYPAAAPPPVTAAARRWEPDPNARVTTGPGLPDWAWERIDLSWRGPVDASQELRLWLIGPKAGFALTGLRVALLALFALLLLRTLRGLRGGEPAAAGEGPAGPASGGSSAPAGASALLLLAIAGGATTLPGVAASQAFPAPELLEQLSERLLAPAECRPECASAPRLGVDADPERLRLRLELDVAADTAVPLPGDATRWSPESVLVDGAPAAALRRDAGGLLWVALTPGRHAVELAGPLPRRDAVEIALPLRPHRVEVRASGWTVEGAGGDEARTADTLRLVREAGATAGADPTPGGESAAPLLPPFARVERRIFLGLRFEVETRVVRASPPGAPIVLSVPVLPGESPTTEGLRIADGRVNVTLPPNVSETRWRSVLDAGDAISLRAPEGVPWSETWIVDASPLWHVQPSGIPTVHDAGDAEPVGRAAAAGARVRTWRPWPGEEVGLSLVRPEGVPGPTLTIDRTELSVAPGLRARDVALEIVLRSSRGGQHTLTLPDGAELQAVALDGRHQPVRQEGRTVTLPLEPGTRAARLEWREPVPTTARLVTPEVDVGAPSVNATVAVDMPLDRWILFVGGPRLGPAVLFWSFLLVVALGAAGLGRVRATPLRARDWFLLGVGMTQAPMTTIAVVVGWLLALGWRREHGESLSSTPFRLLQVGLVVATAGALASLFWAIQQGLLGLPEMQIVGNGSSAERLVWYQDRSDATLPRAWAISTPLWVYRAAMLAWALWIASALLRWLRWGWDAFSTGGAWRALPPLRRQDPTSS